MTPGQHSRRQFLRSTALGGMGLGLAEILALRPPLHGQSDLPRGFGAAKSCIIFFSWGGMSHLETWDPKPDAPQEVRGEYKSIATATAGIQLGEWFPKLAERTNHLHILRGASHVARDHRQAAYLSMTGRPPLGLNGMMVADPVLPTREDPPCLGAMIGKVRVPRRDLPQSVYLPCSIAERGAVAGQNAGFLGPAFDPVVIKPTKGQPYDGISPAASMPQLTLPTEIDSERLKARDSLLNQLVKDTNHLGGESSIVSYRESQLAAIDLLGSGAMATALDISNEPDHVKNAYGNHTCGQSALLARRLSEAGVPLVTVFCAAGDLNGSVGAHWDHHFQIFPRLKNQLMPPLDQASAALLDDLASRGTLQHTLVLWLTEFGRSPAINQLAGRDHWPDCYAMAMAGAGVKAGVVQGRSDKIAAFPEERTCGPDDLHATIFHALGIDPRQSIAGRNGAEHQLTSGRVLNVFS